jgi:hypothetical protein
MTPAHKNKNYKSKEVVKVNGAVYIREPFGREALKTINELEPAGKTINVMQTVLMRKNEGKRFYF